MKSGKKHNALYGRIRIPRGYCSRCEREALIVDEVFQCCNKKVEIEESELPVRRMLTSKEVRRRPQGWAQKQILAEQNYCCGYCDRRFGTIVFRNRKPITLRINWDHIVAWVYSLDNSNENFLASCQICNSMKNAFVFDSIEEVREYVKRRWLEKGYAESLPEHEMQEGIS